MSQKHQGQIGDNLRGMLGVSLCLAGRNGPPPGADPQPPAPWKGLLSTARAQAYLPTISTAYSTLVPWAFWSPWCRTNTKSPWARAGETALSLPRPAPHQGHLLSLHCPQLWKTGIPTTCGTCRHHLQGALRGPRPLLEEQRAGASRPQQRRTVIQA